MLKVEKQHIVNTCSSNCYYWQKYKIVLMSEGNSHEHTELVGVEAGTFFLEVILVIQVQNCKTIHIF